MAVNALHHHGVSILKLADLLIMSFPLHTVVGLCRYLSGVTLEVAAAEAANLPSKGAWLNNAAVQLLKVCAKFGRPVEAMDTDCSFSVESVRKFDAIQAVSELHCRGVAWQDGSLRNVMCQRDGSGNIEHLTLIDFGTSQTVDEGLQTAMPLLCSLDPLAGHASSLFSLQCISLVTHAAQGRISTAYVLSSMCKQVARKTASVPYSVSSMQRLPRLIAVLAQVSYLSCKFAIPGRRTLAMRPVFCCITQIQS